MDPRDKGDIRTSYIKKLSGENQGVSKVQDILDHVECQELGIMSFPS